MLAMDDGDAANAEIWFKKAIEAKPNFRSALFNLALLLNEQKRPLDALPFLLSLHSYYPDHVKGLILMGDIYTNHIKDLRAAESCYKKIIEVEPGHVQGHHNLCVVLVEQGRLQVSTSYHFCLRRRRFRQNKLVRLSVTALSNMVPLYGLAPYFTLKH
jgi:protein O-mannosyl-transferase